MDLSLEEEIVRLSRPPGRQAETEPVTNESATTAVTQRRAAPGSHPPPPPADDSIDASPAGGGFSCTTSSDSSGRIGNGRMGSGGIGNRSPRAAEVLAGQTISDMQLPKEQSGSQVGTARDPRRQQAPHLVRGGGGGGAISNGRTKERRPSGESNYVAQKAAGLDGIGNGGEAGADEEAWRRSEEILKKKEMAVRQALKDKQRTLQQESKLLATVDRELAQLALDHQTEVNELRKTLEVVDRELAFLDRDAQRKLEAFEKARTLLSEKVKQKQGVTANLTQLIMASEKKRDEKLNQIMRKMTHEGAGEQSSGGAGSSQHKKTMSR